MRVLIADDDRISARILESSLQKRGYEVIVVQDGVQAWDILQSRDTPQLAILDWMMPGMDGLEVCRRIRQEGGRPYTYILLLTANTDPSEVVAGINAGADDYIRKPFNIDELEARLRSGRRIVELEEQLRIQARHDALTGLLNRAAILETLEIELERSCRESTPVSIALLDLDEFKKINDTYGHLAGDTVLREMAHKTRTALRPYDFVGRYGGEEFIIIIPNCDLAGVQPIAERLRCLISGSAIDIGTGSITVTTSIGVTTATDCKDSRSLIRAADTALYRAKNQGRNRVEIQPAV